MKKTLSHSYFTTWPKVLLLSLALLLGACTEEQVILPRTENPPPATPTDPGNGQPDPESPGNPNTPDNPNNPGDG